MLDRCLQSMLRDHAIVVASIAIVLMVVGCGGSDYGTPVNVGGKITLDGKPLAELTVIYHSTSGLPAELRTRRAKTDAEGAYSMPEVYPGNYTVLFEQVTAVPEDPGMAPASQSATDASLASYSGENALTANVTNAAADFDFDLVSQRE